MTTKRTSGDYEIVLENRQLVFIFFGAVILCAVFFALGFLIGREQRDIGLRVENAKSPAPDAAATSTKTAAKRSSSTEEPSSGKAAQEAIGKELSFYQAVEGKATSTSSETTAPGQGLKTEKPKAPASSTNAPAAAPSNPASKTSPATATLLFQVAALSKSVDAEALVRKLKDAGFHAFLVSPPADSSGDKLFRVQVGPFTDLAAADQAKGKLVALGYKPILKK
ncbi:MAG: SPOR domain-containing protein [Acidobacteriia bacterium]|nr:SPOR domain-containing protein [Terriglobia bacterium]